MFFRDYWRRCGSVRALRVPFTMPSPTMTVRLYTLPPSDRGGPPTANAVGGAVPIAKSRRDAVLKRPTTPASPQEQRHD
jgi:hypothetical protein